MKSNVCTEASKLVHGARRKSYGHPKVNFARVAGMWSAFLGVPIQPTDVGFMMILLKVSRSRNRIIRDNLVDVAGYAGTIEMCMDEPIRRVKTKGRKRTKS